MPVWQLSSLRWLLGPDADLKKVGVRMYGVLASTEEEEACLVSIFLLL